MLPPTHTLPKHLHLVSNVRIFPVQSHVYHTLLPVTSSHGEHLPAGPNLMPATPSAAVLLLAHSVRSDGPLAPVPTQEREQLAAAAIPDPHADMLRALILTSTSLVPFSMQEREQLAAAAIPDPHANKLRALILTPTRELALQVRGTAVVTAGVWGIVWECKWS